VDQNHTEGCRQIWGGDRSPPKLTYTHSSTKVEAVKVPKAATHEGCVWRRCTSSSANEGGVRLLQLYAGTLRKKKERKEKTDAK